MTMITMNVDIDEMELIDALGGTQAILDMLDYQDILKYVADNEESKEDE